LICHDNSISALLVIILFEILNAIVWFHNNNHIANIAKKIFNKLCFFHFILKLSFTTTLLHKIIIPINIIINHIIRIAIKYGENAATPVNIPKYERKNTGQTGHKRVNKLQIQAVQDNKQTQILCFFIVVYNHTNIPNNNENIHM